MTCTNGIRSFRAKRGISLPFFLALSLLGALPASAQVATGTPPFGSFGGGPDIINLGNLNAHVTIPVLHKPGRGMSFTYDLSYDSSAWYPVGATGSQSWQPVYNWGWRGQTEMATGYVSRYSAVIRTCLDRNGNVTGQQIAYSNWTYHDPFGAFHAFSGVSIAVSGTCGTGTSFTETANDGSGFQLTANGGAYTLYDRNGKNLNAPVGSATGAGTATDRNGNQITVGSGGVFTDTLGTTALTVSGSGTPTSPMTFAYTAPSGASAAYTAKYTAYTVQTKFGCTGISEYGPTSNNLVSEIDLPDWNATTNPNSKYTFTYETTPGDTHNPHYVTGRLASVTLPTGGTITFAYSGGGTGVNGITCADGSAATLTRTTPDGTWTYAQVRGTGAASTTTITDPLGNNTVIQFQGIYETQRQTFQGASSTGTLLQTVYTCYNGSASPCNATAVSLPITTKTVIIQLPGASNLQSKQVYSYNSFGLRTEIDDYDYGSGAPPATPLRKTLVTYATLTNIQAFPQTVTVQNGAGTVIAKTNYNYDETPVVAPPSGTSPQHTSPSGSRGNLTSINYYTNSTTFLTKKMTYFDAGNIQTMTDVNGAQITHNYPDATSTCGNAFPTSISEPLGLSRSMTWNCTGVVQTSLTDENGRVTATAYTDPDFWRPASLTDPTNAVTNFTYTGETQVESLLNYNSNFSTTDILATRDSLGRPHLAQRRQAPGSTNFDTVETDYDSSGRQSRVTLPYTGSSGQTNSTGPALSTAYDTLGRVINVSDSGGGSVAFSYTQSQNNDLYVTRSPAATGENTKRRQEEYDLLGRLTSVCEITAGTTSAPAGTCAQNTSQTGYWTKYAYDAVGNLTGVTQNAQSTGTQSRAYVYDLLGRLTSETNPESGTATYTYDTDSTCGTSNGDRVKKVDAVGNVTCFAYDALHRPTAITYPSGSYASVTPAKYFVYDTATINTSPSPTVMTNVKGRLAEAYTCTGTCSTKLTDEGFSYTTRGEPTGVYQSTPNSGGYYQVTQTYYASGMPLQLSSSVSSLPNFTYDTDGEGRIGTVSASTGQNPVTATSYNAASLPLSATFGSGDSDSFTYDSNTNRLTQYQFTVNTQSLTGALTWNANGTLQKLVITDPFNPLDAQTCTYAYDDMVRLTSANCGSIWSQTFAYDSFGNITKTGNPGNTFQPTYNLATNRYSSIPGVTVSYDANGNVLADGSHTYAWDSVGRPVSVDSVNLTYDALGRMVEQNRSGAYTQIVYAPTGQKFALMSGQTLQKAIIPLSAGNIAVYNSSGLLYYGHHDHLGSARFASTPSRTMYFDLAYAPFGEQYAASGTTDPSFTGQRQDTVAGVHDFSAREYSTQGRWPSPDPLGAGAFILADPQSLNRYAYVLNNPVGFVDALGLGCRKPPPGGTCDNGNGVLGTIGGEDCIIDGIQSPCGLVTLDSDVQCPNNDCALGTSTPFQCVGSVCGYFTNEYVATHENEWNGVLYSNDEWASFLDDRADAQRQALADAISYASDSTNGSNWDYIYNHLDPNKQGTDELNIQGGNVDFRWTGDPSVLSFVPQSAWDTGGCTPCRYGSMDAIHFNHDLFHLDTASPAWGFGLGLVMHGFVDVLLGNINPSIPIGR